MTQGDEGISGRDTNHRDDFNRLLADCNAGKIDMVLVKSISRFARDTVDTLTVTRHLKELGIDVYFEKKDFYTVKVPKNAVEWAFFGTFWCLGGV